METGPTSLPCPRFTVTLDSGMATLGSALVSNFSAGLTGREWHSNSMISLLCDLRGELVGFMYSPPPELCAPVYTSH